MNLGENLITLRKSKNISQEELAEKLDVARQEISKWESGSGYTEMEKILKLCEIFNCSIDTLIKGKINNIEERDIKEYDEFMKKFGSQVSVGVFIILLGVTLLLIYLGLAPDIKNIEEKRILIGVVIVLVFALVSLPLFIINGLKMDAFKKKHVKITNEYQPEEIEQFDKKFAIVVASSVTIILLGVIILILLFGLKTYKNELMPVGIFMIFITISVPMLTYFGIQKDKYDINKYNKINDIITKEANELIGKISAVIMIITTILYFILGFIFNLWKYNWLLFPISGMLCGIFAVILDKNN